MAAQWPATMAEGAELGVTRVWMNRLFGGGSCSPETATAGRENGITVIEGGCLLMFGPTADGGHKLFKTFGTWTGKVQSKVEEPALGSKA